MTVSLSRGEIWLQRQICIDSMIKRETQREHHVEIVGSESFIGQRLPAIHQKPGERHGEDSFLTVLRKNQT